MMKRVARIPLFINTRYKGTKEAGKNVVPAPLPTEISQKNAVFDKVTHTGQAWDQADVRLARFTMSEKQVNPNIAANLISEIPPIASEDHVVHCDGGHPALGHPKVYINLDKPGTHACGYCGLRFYNSHITNSKDLGIASAHIQV